MDERRIEHTNQAYLWQLVIAAAVTVLVIWAGFKLFDRDRQRTQAMAHGIENPVASPASIPVPVHEFVSFIRGNSPQDRMGLDHAFTSASIRKMADALRAVALQYDLSDVDVTSDLEKLRHYANRLQEDQSSTEHAESIRDAFILASDLMEVMQQQIKPHLGDRVVEVRQAAEAIEPDRLARRQKIEVETFFMKAAGLLEGLARAKG